MLSQYDSGSARNFGFEAVRLCKSRTVDVNALTLGRFLRQVDAKGELARQVLRDDEARAVSSPEPSPLLPASKASLRLVKTDTQQPSPMRTSQALAQSVCPRRPALLSGRMVMEPMSTARIRSGFLGFSRMRSEFPCHHGCSDPLFGSVRGQDSCVLGAEFVWKHRESRGRGAPLDHRQDDPPVQRPTR